MNQELIGKFILELRKEKNMTQKELADKIGVSDRAVSHYESGRRLPDYSVMNLLCDALDINIYELFSCEKNTNIQIEKNYLDFLLNTIKYYEEQKYIDYKKLKTVVKINNRYEFVSLLMSNKKITQSIDDKKIITEYKNIEVIEPYIKIEDEFKNISDYEFLLPLEIFEKSYNTSGNYYFDYEDFSKLNIKEKINKYFENIDDIYNRTIEGTFKYIEENDYSYSDFNECLEIYINNRLNELDLENNLKQGFILLSIVNINYIEIYKKIYDYIK